MKVFISHSQKDTKIAEELTSKLSRAGLDVWLAEREVLPGDNWSLEAGKALQRANALVVLLSPDAVESDNVKREISFALSSPRFEGRIVPVVLKPTRDIPWFLETLQMIHSRGTDTKSLSRAAKQIVASLLDEVPGENLVDQIIGKPRAAS
jgi:hypothetical protein